MVEGILCLVSGMTIPGKYGRKAAESGKHPTNTDVTVN